MKWIITLLFISTYAFSQAQDNIPQITDVYSGNSLAQSRESVTMGENIVIGDKLIGLVRSPSNVVSFGDTFLNSWTCTTPLATVSIPFFLEYIYFCYADVTVGGASDVVTACTPGNCNLTVFRGVHLGALDGSVVNKTNTGSGFTTFTSTVPTTANGDVIITGMICDDAGCVAYLRGETLLAAADGASSNYAAIQTKTTALGNYVITADADIPCGFGNCSSQAMQSLAFKPKTITLTDTALHHAASGVAYSDQLHGVGGIAAQTYACTGLPANGLSLNGTTGKITGATPTPGTLNLSCTTSDGTSSSSPVALTLKIDASVNTPQIVNSGLAADTTTTAVPNVQCGDYIGVFARGDNTHNTGGWLPLWNGANNNVNDTALSVVQRYVGPFGGALTMPIVFYMIGPILVPGTDSITFVGNQSSSINTRTSYYYLLRNVQGPIDPGAITNIMLKANSTVSTTYTPVVDDTLLLGAVVGQASTTIGALGTPSMNSPFNILSTGGDASGSTIYGYYLDPTTSAVTLSNTLTSMSDDNSWSSMIVPIRPGIPNAVCLISKLHVESQVY